MTVCQLDRSIPTSTFEPAEGFGVAASGADSAAEVARWGRFGVGAASYLPSAATPAPEAAFAVPWGRLLGRRERFGGASVGGAAGLEGEYEPPTDAGASFEGA